MFDDELLECKTLQEEEYEVIEVSRKLSIIVPLMTSSKQSIYPGYSSSNVTDGVLKLEIPVEFPEPKTVTLVQDDSLTSTSTSTSTSISTTANPDIDAPQLLSLSSLPPLVISLILPPSYPLASPPHVTSIRATNLWLPQSPPLQAILTRMWQPGEGILYNWIEFIRTGEFLNALSLTSSTDDHTIRYVNFADRSICWCNAQS